MAFLGVFRDIDFLKFFYDEKTTYLKNSWSITFLVICIVSFLISLMWKTIVRQERQTEAMRLNLYKSSKNFAGSCYENFYNMCLNLIKEGKYKALKMM